MRRILALLFVLATAGSVQAATITFGAVAGNWSDATKWVGAATPTASDDVVFNATSAAASVNNGSCLAKTVTCTGYLANLQFNAASTLTVAGNVLFAATHTLGGTGTLLVNTAASLTSAGLTFPGSLVISTSGTISMADAWTVSGNWTSQTASNTINSNSVTIGGSLILSSVNLSGSTNFTLNGSGAVSCVQQGFLNNRYLAGTFTINTAGSVTFSPYFNFQGTMNVVAGTVDMTTNATQLTLWNNVRFQGEGVTFASLQMQPSQNGNSNAVSFAATKTYTITTKLLVTQSVDGVTTTLRSDTASSAATIRYTGTLANQTLVGVTFTDIDATGSAQPWANLNGGTLTRTTNIVNYPNASLLTRRGFVF